MTQEMSEDFAPETSDAYHYALKLLGRRPYSREKLRKKLIAKKFPPELNEKVLDYLIAKNYLNEEEYLRAKVAAYLRKNESPHLIQQKLKREKLQLSKDEILQWGEEKGMATQQQLENLFEKKFQSLMRQKKVLDPLKMKAKLFRYIVSKGHDSEAALSIIKKNLPKNLKERD